jgi:uncharacterized protein (TIGR04255 family)
MVTESRGIIGADFPHLSRSPIMEAVLQIRAPVPISADKLAETVKKTFPDYSPGPSTSIGSRMLGTSAMLRSGSDNKRWLSISPDGFQVSEVGVYPGWTAFSRQTQELWTKFRISFGVADPIGRASLRFINLIKLPTNYRLEDFLQSPPRPPAGVDLTNMSMMGQEVFTPHNLPYVIRILRTVQEDSARANGGPALILDLEVESIHPFEAERLNAHMEAMRDLINKVFFGTITTSAVENFK